MSEGLTLSKINDITIRIISEQDLPSLLASIMDSAREFLRTEGASLLLYDKETDELVFDIARGARGGVLAKKRVPAGQGLAGYCASQKAPVVVNDAQSDARLLRTFDSEGDFVTKKLIAVPMMSKTELIGVLEVVNTLDGRDFDKSDVRMLTYLSNMAALAIRNRQLYEDLKQRKEELDCVYQISQSIRMEENIDTLLDAILVEVEKVLEVERLSVLLQDEGEKGLRIARSHGFTPEEGDVRIDPNSGIAGIVFRSGDPLLVRDVEKELRLSAESSNRYRTKSFVSVPILQGDRVIGILNAADKKDSTSFDIFEMKVLSTVASQIGEIATRILARNREMELKSYRKDLETAAQIQMNSLPLIPDRIAGLEIATRYDACKDVGGDFYDLIYHSDERISLVMADVAGKGVPAALFMEYSKTLLSGQITRSLDPATTLAKVNEEIYRNSRTGLFVTVMLLQIELDLKRIRLASAGHNHQILFRQKTGEVETLSAGGSPLGVMPKGKYIEKVVEYDPGDLLVLYTDGITESCNSQYEEFGEEGLFALVREHSKSEPPAILDTVFASILKHRAGAEQPDDATIMVVRL